jgi:hypothetical protein
VSNQKLQISQQRRFGLTQCPITYVLTRGCLGDAVRKLGERMARRARRFGRAMLGRAAIVLGAEQCVT